MCKIYITFSPKRVLCTASSYTQLYNATDFILTKTEVSSMIQCMPSMCTNFICNLATPQRPTLNMTGNTAPCCAGSEDVVTIAAWPRKRILYCFKLGKTAAKTVEMMRQVYGDNCLSRAQIIRWYARFKSGVETTEEARPGRPFCS